MIKIDEELFARDIKYTADAIQRTNSKSFIIKEYNFFHVSNIFLALNFLKMVNEPNKLKEYGDIKRLIDKSSIKSFFHFYDFLEDNKETLTTMSDSFLKIMSELNFNDYPYFKLEKKYSPKEFKELVLSYFATYGDRIYKIVKKIFDENRVQIGSENYKEGIPGSTCFIQWLDSSYVFIMNEDYSIYNATILCHELGHCIDSESLLFPQQKFLQLDSDPLRELASTSYELGFVDYLEKNHIEVGNSQLLFNEILYNTLIRLEIISKVEHLKDAFIYEDGLAIATEDKETIEELANEVLEDFKNNKKELTSNDEETDIKRKILISKLYEDMEIINKLEASSSYNLISGVLYGLGYYMSLHLGLIREDSIKDFNRILNNICTLRKEITLEEAINMMGFKLDEFTSGELIKPKINSSCLELRKRYKY